VYGVPTWAVDSVTSPRGVTGHAAGVDLRPMALDDVEATMAVVEAADAALAEAGLLPPRTPPTDAQVEASRVGHSRFVQRDGPGAWVAVSEGRVVGVAESVRRESFWGLSMLFVHPEFQSRGVGGRLLEAALSYATGATERMIQSSPDPRAMRRYFLAGLAMHPTAEMGGQPDRRAIPTSLPGRDGEEEDLELVAEVETQLGRSRTEDVAFVLGGGRCRFDVVDGDPGRGWVLWREDRLVMLGATDEQTAAVLLWRFLAGSEGQLQIHGLTAAQQWAFDVLHQARLAAQIRGSLFVDGMAIPAPWIASGWYF
jgi:GNAT superfamily N-acetyltransferase